MQGLPPAKGSHDSNRLELQDMNARDSQDEEAQLLRRGGPNFRDDHLPTHQATSRKPGIWNFLQGPSPPEVLSIRPLFPALQKAPVKWLAARRTDKKVIFTAALFLWFIVFIFGLRTQLPSKDGAGNYVTNLDCTDTLWRRKNECGLNGIDCRPFNNHAFAFKCPANCASVQLLNPRNIGPEEVNYRPLVIGAGPYRGDSFICSAAIHSGIISNERGGCGRVSLQGNHDIFESTKAHGIESIAFDSYFPLSFSITTDDSFRCSSDPRSVLLPISLIFTTAFAIFSTSPLIFFPIFVLIFAHVAFVSDPPTASFRNVTVLPDHISMFAKRMLPAFFIAVVMYKAIIKRTLSGLTAQYEKAIFWLGGFWIGALSNYTFDWIPISRLTAHDLQQQPGAKLALAVIIIILVAIVAGQAYYFWLEGRLLRHLGLYASFLLAILFCLAIPGVNLRIHHYILALLFLPGTNLQTRLSLLYQGILLGLFVNGIARWDFDSVLQTSDALRADAKMDSVVPDMIAPKLSTVAESLIATFTWPPPRNGMDGISMLVNDVERTRFFYEDATDGAKYEWTRALSMSTNEYFRWAYLKDGRTLDYSKAAMLGNGTWIELKTKI